MRNCVFIDNRAERSRESSGGAISVWGRANPEISGCTFLGNRARRGGGALGFYGSSRSTISDCLFVENRAELVGGGGIECSASSAPRIRHCTFSASAAPAGGTLYCKDRARPSLENTIIAFGLAGEAVACVGRSRVALRCCSVIGNAGGDWVGALSGLDAGEGNVALEPLFENPREGDYRLRGDSPLRRLTGCAPPGVRAPTPLRQ